MPRDSAWCSDKKEPRFEPKPVSILLAPEILPNVPQLGKKKSSSVTTPETPRAATLLDFLLPWYSTGLRKISAKSRGVPGEQKIQQRESPGSPGLVTLLDPVLLFNGFFHRVFFAAHQGEDRGSLPRKNQGRGPRGFRGGAR